MDEEPSEERLVADWALTLEDMFEVEKCRGESNRRWFAVQLCFLRNKGRFVEDFTDFPIKIINFISLQLGLPPVLLMTELGREATISSYCSRLQIYLGVQDLSDKIENGLRKTLKQEAVAGKNERDLMNKVSCLSLLSNAALIWNTIEIGKIIEQLRLSGEEIKDEHIAGISPLIFRHIIPSGTYHFREVIEGDTIALNTLE